MSKTEMPSIRFYGFDNDWEQRKLGNLLMFAVAEIINICRKALYPFMERADICLA